MRRPSTQEKVQHLIAQAVPLDEIAVRLELAPADVARYVPRIAAKNRRERPRGVRRYARRVDCEVIAYSCGNCGREGHNRRSCPARGAT